MKDDPIKTPTIIPGQPYAVPAYLPTAHTGYRPAEDIARDLMNASSNPAVRRVQAWLADEREAGRCVFGVTDVWIARLLEAANGKA